MAARFTGTYYRALDSKGRFILPPSFLHTLTINDTPGPFWLTCLYGRLTAYLPEHWEKIIEKLCQIPIPSVRLSNFKTKIIGLAHELTPDTQGRIHIPQSLIREAALGKDIVLVGILDKFEIWNQMSFENIAVEDVSEELGKYGIDISL